MKIESLIVALEYVRILCQVPKPAEHAYIVTLFDELKDVYTDNNIANVAREICRNEKLYGVFPALKTWLEYCPMFRQSNRLENKTAVEFMDEIIYVIRAEEDFFNLQNARARVWEKYGNRALITLEQFGGLKSIRANYHKASQFEQERVLREIRQAWDDTGKDEKLGVLENQKSLEAPETLALN